MILRIKEYEKELSLYDTTIPKITQNMSEEELIKIIENYDYWIAGDDPVTENVLKNAKKLKTLIKWGIGIDNIDLNSIKKFNINFHNTPGMFGNEVADIAIGYLLMLTRNLHKIDREVRKGIWYKPTGISLVGKKVGLIGFGDIGRNIASRLLSLNCIVHIYDPGFTKENNKIKCLYSNIEIDERLDNLILENNVSDIFVDKKIIIIACSANKDNYHLINDKNIEMMANNSYIINVSRGSIVDENSVIRQINEGKLEGFAADVFEEEPLNSSHPFLDMEKVVLGSHNASNTLESVDKTSLKSIELLQN
jgi:D-3-phosphoglycerate dehydrogenase